MIKKVMIKQSPPLSIPLCILFIERRLSFSSLRIKGRLKAIPYENECCNRSRFIRLLMAFISTFSATHVPIFESIYYRCISVSACISIDYFAMSKIINYLFMFPVQLHTWTERNILYIIFQIKMYKEVDRLEFDP